MKRKVWKAVMLVSMVVLGCVLLPVTSHAEEKQVEIDTSNYNGGKAIQDALSLQQGTPQYDLLTITLKPGTYDITEALTVYSNTKIEATGATIKYVRTLVADPALKGKAPIITSFCAGKSGYEGTSNISINGGTWDMQGATGQVNHGYSMESFRFMHANNLSFTNMVMTNLYESHYLTIEGVKDVTIQGCTFKNQVSIKAKKEAIHIDCLNNENMAPSNQENVVYDDTYCKNIKVDGCTFSKVPRGLGTHIAVAGLYPSDIAITNNTFTDITYEAIKAYHYKNLTITGNTIQNAGMGVKVYLYAEPSDNDNDEEGANNYLPALPGTATEGVPADLHTVINNNIISDISNAKDGFAIHVSGNSNRVMNGITITDNIIAKKAMAYSAKLGGIYTKYVNQCVISGNRVNDVSGNGVLLSETTNVTVQDNIVKTGNSDGILAQRCGKVTLKKNTISDWTKHCVYAVSTTALVIDNNTVSKDKQGGICVDKDCPKAKIQNNTSTSSGKNALGVLASKNVQITNNTVENAKNFGIFTTQANKAVIKNNKITGTKSTGIISEKSNGARVTKNTVAKAGKYGILFNKTVKSSASNNVITDAKDYSLIYSDNSKNKKTNMKYQNLSVKAKKTSVSGHTTPGLKVTVSTLGKSKTKKAPKNGNFSIKVKKLKKGQKVTLILQDTLGNKSYKNVTAK